MQVKFLQSIAGNGSPDGRQFPTFFFAEGFVGNIVDDTLAQAWIDSGICEAASIYDKPRPPKPEFAVAVPVETAVAKGRQSQAKPSAKPEPTVEAKVEPKAEAEVKGE